MVGYKVKKLMPTCLARFTSLACLALTIWESLQKNNQKFYAL